MINETITIKITGNSKTYNSRISIPGKLNVGLTMSVFSDILKGLEQESLKLLIKEGFKGGDEKSHARIDKLRLEDLRDK